MVKFLMKFFWTLPFIFIMTYINLSWGDLDTNAVDMAAPDKRALMAQGQLMSVKVVPADKSAKLYILGKKAAESKPSIRPKLLQVTAFNKDEEEELHLTPEGEYYTVSNPKLKRPYSLRVRAKVEEKEEKFEIKVPQNTVP